MTEWGGGRQGSVVPQTRAHLRLCGCDRVRASCLDSEGVSE